MTSPSSTTGSATLSSLAPWIGLTVGALALLLVGEVRGLQTLKRAMKPLASSGYLGVAVAAGALGQPYGQAVLVALVLCWVGDVVLLGKSSAALMGGLGAFLLGHVGFVAAFLIHGVRGPVALASGVGLCPVVAVVLGRLWPLVPRKMRPPVLAYIAVITTMVAAAAGAVSAGLPSRVGVGAALFFVSDLFVARNRFGTPAAINRLVGLPLYYGGVLLLASSAAG